MVNGNGSLVQERESPPRWNASLAAGPNALVRWAFYLSIFALSFGRVYIPGTGDRLGVTRVIQMLLVCAVLSQPRVCLRLIPVALLWFVGYYALRVASGLWLSPELAGSWWPDTLEWLQFSLPWAWIMFNVLQYPGMARGGLWALVWGCVLCALLHIGGIGVAVVDTEFDVRTTIFGENANVVGAAYAVAIIVLIGLSMLKEVKLRQRLLIFSLAGILGLGLAKTGSRTAALLVMMGVMVLMFQAEAFASRAKRYATVLLLGAVFAGVIWQVPTVMKRFDSSALGRNEGRVRMMPVMWNMFLRSPIYGSGPDQYQYELTRRAMPHLIRERKTIAAHNLALLLLVETGIIGLAVFSAGLWKALAAAWRARAQASGFLPLALLLPMVIAGMVVSNPSYHLVFWFAIAYALAGAGRTEWSKGVMKA